METPPKEYIEWPGPNAPMELQILAKMCMRWLEMGLVSYEGINEVYDEVAEKLQEASE